MASTWGGDSEKSKHTEGNSEGFHKKEGKLVGMQRKDKTTT